MKILLTTIILFNLFSCQEKTPIPIEKEVQEKIVAEKKSNSKEDLSISNGIVFKDAQGNILSESQKDSIVENTTVQALRRFDDELNNSC